jgi:hypothetical protein
MLEVQFIPNGSQLSGPSKFFTCNTWHIRDGILFLMNGEEPEAEMVAAIPIKDNIRLWKWVKDDPSV